MTTIEHLHSRNEAHHGGLLSVLIAREPKGIPKVCYLLSVSCWNTPEIILIVGQISTLSVVRDNIVRHINRSPVRVAFRITVKQPVLASARTRGATGGVEDVPAGGLVGTGVRGQHERARREKPLIRVVKCCLPCN